MMLFFAPMLITLFIDAASPLIFFISMPAAFSPDIAFIDAFRLLFRY